MKTRNIAFKLAVLAAVLAAGYAFGFAKGGSRTARENPPILRQCAWRWLKSRRKLTN
ncbi:hypothetical protein ND436_002890 [Neisseria gonorrhoeae]|nr:hypothetical protein ND436_002890 [Neisseria gonorrhoeae]